MRLVGPGNAPYPATARWADPILECAAEQMKLVYEERIVAPKRASAGRKFIQSKFSPVTVGSAMATRLEMLRSRGSGRKAFDKLPIAAITGGR